MIFEILSKNIRFEVYPPPNKIVFTNYFEYECLSVCIHSISETTKHRRKFKFYILVRCAKRFFFFFGGNRFSWKIGSVVLFLGEGMHKYLLKFQFEVM